MNLAETKKALNNIEVKMKDDLIPEMRAYAETLIGAARAKALLRQIYIDKYKEIKDRNTDAYLNTILQVAKKDMFWNRKLKKKYKTVENRFFSLTMPEYMEMAFSSMKAMVLDIFSYTTWKYTNEMMGTSPDYSQLYNLYLIMKAGIHEWKQLTSSSDYETNFKKRFENRLEGPGYFSPYLRREKIETSYHLIEEYFQYINQHIPGGEAALKEFMSDINMASDEFSDMLGIWVNRRPNESTPYIFMEQFDKAVLANDDIKTASEFIVHEMELRREFYGMKYYETIQYRNKQMEIDKDWGYQYSLSGHYSYPDKAFFEP